MFTISPWMPVVHKSNHLPIFPSDADLPLSLLEAIDAFLLACAIRKVRGQGDQHSSMLIHVTRFNAVQKIVHSKVEEYVLHLRQRMSRKIGHEQILDRMQNLWKNDFIPTRNKILEDVPNLHSEYNESWPEISNALISILDEISVRMINGTAKDALDYADSATGLKVIAIGGDKLARGLTLEGLCTSYFLRASRMYDTLMQMGRWFGYRPGYLDLCRLYTTDELVEWFEHIADAAEELREEFDYMVACGGTPKDYGLKVKSHSVLMVTSRLKMRTARSLYLSFSGDVVETVSLYKDVVKIQHNLNAFNSLIQTAGSPAAIPSKKRGNSNESWTGAFWKNIPSQNICDFLNQYETHPSAHKVNSKMLAEFILSMNAVGELTSWTVAVIGGKIVDKTQNISGIQVPMTVRTGNDKRDDRYSIGRLLSPKDEGIDLEEDSWMAALDETRNIWNNDPGRLKNKIEPNVPSGKSLRRIRGFGAKGIQAKPENGLLLIYLLDPESAKIDFDDNTSPIVAFGISFPGSNSGVKVEYKVNNVMWEQEYGSAE